jgi:hypothetical protein
MIVLDADTMAQLLDGEDITTTTHKPQRAGTAQPTGVRPGRSLINAIVISCQPAEPIEPRAQDQAANAGYTLTLRPIPNQAPARFLARNPGAQHRDYVDRPSKGMRGEPEAIPKEDERDLGLAARIRHEPVQTAQTRAYYASKVAELDDAMRTALDHKDRVAMLKLKKKRDRARDRLKRLGDG